MVLISKMKDKETAARILVETSRCNWLRTQVCPETLGSTGLLLVVVKELKLDCHNGYT